MTSTAFRLRLTPAVHVTQPQGTGAKAHTHPNEQLTFVAEGLLDAELEGDRMTVNERCLLHVPAGMAHALAAPRSAL